MTIGTAALKAPYKDLARADLPRLVREAVALYGTFEAQGAKDNPDILAWAKEAHVGGYNADSIPWCGLFAAIVATRAGWQDQIPASPLWALAWLDFGEKVESPVLGDILVYQRKGGGHVCLYVGEDGTHYHCLGGNQGDQVSIIRLPKARAAGNGLGFRGAVRPKYRIAQPASAVKVLRSNRGVVVGGSLA